MTDEFPKFAKIVKNSLQNILKGKPFEVKTEGDVLYNTYLKAFPKGTDPLFKNRTEHDCSCCKNFIRHVGFLVSVNDNGSELKTIWDEAAVSAPYPYNIVASELKEIVSKANIKDLFLVNEKETSFGNEKTRSLDKETNRVINWDHFYSGDIPSKYLSKTKDTVRGNYKTTVQVFERGLKELSPEAFETVISLINVNNLYRGQEFKESVVKFQKIQKDYIKSENKDYFCWKNAESDVSRVRNTAMGKLLQDLSEGKDLEKAVNSFESMVAPTNYKRTTAPISPMMIKKAMEKSNGKN